VGEQVIIERVSNPLLQIIIGSTRPGRVGLPIGRWIEKAALDHGGFDVELVDLAEVNLPIFDEPKHPMLRQYTHDHTKAWSATIERADAFVMVMPEYNHSFNAALKNAIDYLSHEWRHKPVGTVSYGGVAAGIRAVQQLKPVLSVLSMVPLTAAVPIPFVAKMISGEGDDKVFTPTEEVAAGATVMLDALAAWIPASKLLREA
jgi:NAD(P)H-dependent FMN reductase